MYKFSHLADCHIGANRNPTLEKLELAAFKKAMEICIREEVDFILITGDLFHSNLPDMYAANEAVKSLKKARDAQIPIYIIYGSHDYSPNETSIVDILSSTGLVTKIVKGQVEESTLKLKVFIDPKTKAKLVGISARKAGLEKEYFNILDRESLENEKGFKIFAFHSAISEFKPSNLAQMESIPISLLPKGFDYYASGHIHHNVENSLPGYEKIVYPGTIFSGYSRDLEDSAKGAKRGFYLVTFDEQIEKVEFIEVNVCDFAYFEFDFTNKNTLQAKKELFERLSEAEVKGKLAVVKIKGELSSGKTSDISSSEIREELRDAGALEVIINRYGLSSKEYLAIKVVGEDIPTIENRIFKENIGAAKVTIEELKADKGTKLATNLLKILRQEQKLNETKRNYNERTQRNAIDLLDLKEELR